MNISTAVHVEAVWTKLMVPGNTRTLYSGNHIFLPKGSKRALRRSVCDIYPEYLNTTLTVLPSFRN